MKASTCVGSTCGGVSSEAGNDEEIEKCHVLELVEEMLQVEVMLQVEEEQVILH